MGFIGFFSGSGTAAVMLYQANGERSPKQFTNMRKVTNQIASAFNSGVSKSISNTNTDGKAIYLHGNKIAEKRDGKIWITSAGWNTNTTKERLNALSGVSIQQKKGDWFLNGQKWSGSWVCVD